MREAGQRLKVLILGSYYDLAIIIINKSSQIKSMYFRADAMPRWRGVNHFKNIMDIHFSDANKFEDILKV